MPEVFRFKYFDVAQDKCAMKIGTDAMLLGAFAEASGCRRVLDIGTGTGVLALMMGQKVFINDPKADTIIDAIEIDHEASTQATENVAQSPWRDRIHIINTSLQDFTTVLKDKYDIIISNPPFFEPGNLDKGKDSNGTVTPRTSARSMVQLTTEALLNGVNMLLAENGRFTVIFPFSSFDDMNDKAAHKGLHLQKRILIRSYKDEHVIRVIATFGREKTLVKESEFVIYSSYRRYSEEYKELTKEFHGKNLL